MKMDLMKELLNEGKKTKVSKATARAVYHRDYEKTKKKPYRKYDGQEDEEVTDDLPDVDDDKLKEGVWDFVKGAGQHVGQSTSNAVRQGAQRIQQGVQKTVQAGRDASQAADNARLTKLLVQALDQYLQLTKNNQPDPQQQAPAAVVRANRQPVPQQPQLPPRSFTQAHKARDARLQFSSFLPTLDNSDLITEGAWDFIKGAGKVVGDAVSSRVQQGAQKVQQGVQNTIQAGRDASQAADIQSAKAKVQQIATKILWLIRTNVLPLETFRQLLGSVSPEQSLAASSAYKIIINNLRKRS